MSRNNVDIPIYAMTPRLATLRKLALYRNVVALPFGGGQRAKNRIDLIVLVFETSRYKKWLNFSLFS